MAATAKDKKTAAVAETAAVTDTAVVDGAVVESSVAETTATDETEPAPEPLTKKSAFEAALARKKQAGQARSAHLDGHGGVGGATSSHKSSRTFRRKSGSA